MSDTVLASQTQTTPRLASTFAAARAANKTVFIPFVSAGDPSLSVTVAVLREVDRLGAALGVPLVFEIGFPYSDPIADGPAIQSSYNRALAAGFRLADLWAALSSLRSEIDAPLVGMASYSLVYRKTAKTFLADARAAGLDGLIVPDLPLDEADDLANLAAAVGIDLVQLVAPTTPPARAERIAKQSRGFVYCVSVAGITGERRSIPTDLGPRVTQLRRCTELPVCVGFGISQADQVRDVSQLADGVIVGSALVRQLALVDSPAAIGPVIDKARELMGGLT